MGRGGVGVLRRVIGTTGLGGALLLCAAGLPGIPRALGASSHEISAAGAVSPAGVCRAPEESASYRVTFTSTWRAATHPDAFPPTAHFSDLIGATHSARWTLWAVGGLASPGIERMAEGGKARPLADEVGAAIRTGDAGTLLRGPDLERSPGSVSLDFRVTRAFPLVSLVSMLAPSPDWFIGVAGFSLCDDDRWATERTVVLYAYDAGTDSGTTYETPDLDTQPREPIRRIEWPPFHVAGEVRPVGTFTFRRRGP